MCENAGALLRVHESAHHFEDTALTGEPYDFAELCVRRQGLVTLSVRA